MRTSSKKMTTTQNEDRDVQRSGRAGRYGVATAALVFGLTLAGCKAKPVDDAALTTSIKGQISADSSISGQTIQVGVQNGVATLDGSVMNDAQRTIAARDAAGVAGVKEVVNNLSVTPASVTAGTVAPSPIAVPIARVPAALPPAESNNRVERERMERERMERERQDRSGKRQPAPIERQPGTQGYSQAPAQTAPPPPQPAAPAFRSVTVPAGNSLSVRVTQTLDSATAQAGQTFSGVIASDVVIDGLIAIPSGSTVTGQVDAVQEAAHFKGASLLTVSLSGLSRRGDRVALSTEPYTVEGKARGKNTLEKTGIGAAGGAILGGIFGGGKGAAIGAAAGGGVGAGANAVTRGQQVQIPSETVVRFRLTSPVTVRVRTDAGARNDGGDPALQRRPNN